MLKNLKPAEGLQIFDPVLKDRLPPEGRQVTNSPYWEARIRDRDVIDLDAEKEAADRKAIGDAGREKQAKEKAERDARKTLEPDAPNGAAVEN